MKSWILMALALGVPACAASNTNSPQSSMVAKNRRANGGPVNPIDKERPSAAENAAEPAKGEGAAEKPAAEPPAGH